MDESLDRRDFGLHHCARHAAQAEKMSGATFNPGGVPLGARLARFASTRLLHEWSQLQPWDVPPVYELRLGPTPLTSAPGIITPAQENMLRNFNRYADMIGITAHEIQVIEAKMQFDPGAISQVLHYVDLVHYTPILKEFSGRMVVPVILVAFNDPGLHQRAAAQGDPRNSIHA